MSGDGPTSAGVREKELRLALVCYGGISLAVYMHGIVKEVWHLARASRAAQDDAKNSGATLGGSAGVYAALIAELERDAGVRLRVLPDIVAGASAGGINGIFLAQAISTGQSLDPLTDLWLEQADVEALIDPTAAPATRFSKLWALPLAWIAAGRGVAAADDLEEATREEVRAKLAHFIRSRWFEPPFSGAGFTAMLLDAFAAMAAGERGPRLLPDGQPLDLFVTVTDFTGHPERLRLHSPAEVVETEHRLVFPFSDAGRAGELAAAPELAFAARATSSFPGAFPPFTVAEIDGVLAERRRAWPGRRAFLRRVLPRHAFAGAADKAVLIDGSVLANAPFRPAIDALRARPARREIDRRFVYVDPAPGHKLTLGRPGGDVPGFFPTILGALSELPRQQPIRDNLEALAERSERIERMRGIIAAIRPEVEAEIEALFGRTLFLDRPTPARLVAWRRRAQVAAADRAGFGYAGYGHLKASGVIDTIATLVHGIEGVPGPERRRRVRERVAAGFAARGLSPDAIHAGSASEATIAFLRTWDIGFRIRRLRLLARRVAEMEMEVAPAILLPLREAVYDALGRYLERNSPTAHAALRPHVRSVGDDAGALLDRLAAALDLTGLDAETDAAMAAALSALPREVRRPMLLHYLGFPCYDLATLPLLQGEGVDEYDPIKVDRISPDDARAIRGGGAEATLKGIQFNNFGAFFSRAYRENDYLWGRLHSAERMIDILVSALPADARLRPGRLAAVKRAAFRAILDEEEERLAASSALIATLRAEVG